MTSHSELHKKKLSGGKKCAYRKKRRRERGSFPNQMLVGKQKTKVEATTGNKTKVRLTRTNTVNVSDSSTGQTRKVSIIGVIKNPANVDYNRRGVVTKGTHLETPLGKALVTSRPGQSGVLNAVLISEGSEAGS